jgi:hypothetical protein
VKKKKRRPHHYGIPELNFIDLGFKLEPPYSHWVTFTVDCECVYSYPIGLLEEGISKARVISFLVLEGLCHPEQKEQATRYRNVLYGNSVPVALLTLVRKANQEAEENQLK